MIEAQPAAKGLFVLVYTGPPQLLDTDVSTDVVKPIPAPVRRVVYWDDSRKRRAKHSAAMRRWHARRREKSLESK